MNTYTEFCQGKLPADFSGVLYSDTGRLNYTVAINGKILKNKRNMNRWFKSHEAAARAIVLPPAQSCCASNRGLDNP